MGDPFLGSEALASGALNSHTLRTRFTAVYPNVYVDSALTASSRAQAAWLWSKRRAVIAGNSAAALHRTPWVGAHEPAELIHDNRHPPQGIRTFADHIEQDEIVEIRGMPVCSPVRAALDIGCRRPLDAAVAAIDALAHATHLEFVAVEKLAARYPGRRGLRNVRRALELVDAGAESPRETWLRLLIIRAGFPRPQTQITVRDEYGYPFARVDMGWENLKIGAEYDGGQHRVDPEVFARDIHRLEALANLGWVIVRVTKRDPERGIINRLNRAFARRA